jgi:hypothetical protein
MQNTGCDGCGANGETVDSDGFCFECQTYLKSGHTVALNLCAWLERWRKRHDLSRAEAVRVARRSLELKNDILEAAMAGENRFSE